MRFHLQGCPELYEPGLRYLSPRLDAEFGEGGIPVEVSRGAPLCVGLKDGKGWICAADRAQFFRGLGLLMERAARGEAFARTESPVFDHLAASFDMSRNGVLTAAALETLLCRMALMGYTQIMLYTEDVYEVEGYPLFGYLRGSYTQKELRHLDDFSDSLGIELVPCIQTLGHLERFLHWESSAPYRDTNDVLLAGNEKTYALIEAMFASVRSCCRSDKIHVGMDEAMGLGLGGYLRENGYRDAFSIMREHIDRVCEIAQKYGFHPMMWSDMYFRCASKTHSYYEEGLTIPQAVIDAAPPGMDLVYWDYYHSEKAFYDHYIGLHQQFAAKTWFAGGMWTWLGPAVDYDVFFKNSLPALQSCVENGVRDVIVTAWGDDGAEANVWATLLALQVYAEYCYTGAYQEEPTAQRLFACTGADAGALRRIAAFNKTPRLDPDSDLPNAAKFLLYQDPLAGLYDRDIEGLGFAESYARLVEEFDAYAAQKGPYEKLYAFYARLADVLRDKAELGIGLVRAYERGDQAALGRLAKQAARAADACPALRSAWEALWFSTNKPFGFEVLEARVCGVEGRLRACARRVEDYCAGKVPEIGELAQERLLLLRGENTRRLHGVYFWREIVSSARAY